MLVRFWTFYAGIVFAAIIILGGWEAWHDGYRHGASGAWALVQHVIDEGAMRKK